MAEFQLNGQLYSAGRLNAKQQFHVARRLAPLLKGFGDVVKNAGGIFSIVEKHFAGKLKEDLKKIDPFEMVQPLADALNEMSDENANYIIDACCGVTQRRTGSAWGPVIAPNGMPMYPDMDWSVIIMIVIKVVEANLLNFTDATA